jgi:hypothetical protein
MNSFLLIGVCIAAGLLLRHFRLVPQNTYKWINVWIIYIALPAVSFKYLPYLQWSVDMLLPLVTPVLIFLGGLIYVELYTRLHPVDRLSKGGLQLVAGLGNTSFIGFPLIIAYFGEEYLSTGVICDQVTFLLLSSAGLIVAVKAQGSGKLPAGKIALKIVSFPPFLGCILALTLPLLIDASPAMPVFSALAASIGPLALFSIGLQLTFKGLRTEWKHISAVLLYKLLIAPVLILLIALTAGMSGKVPTISVFEAAMPVQLSAGILTSQYNLNPARSNAIIGISILVSFLTTGAWYFILKALL